MKFNDELIRVVAKEAKNVGKHLEAEIIEFPTSFGEWGLANLIIAEPDLIGEDVEIIKREFTLPTKKSIDLLARSRGEFLIVEVKDCHKNKNLVIRGGLEQLKGYLKGFMQMASIFGLKPAVRLILVLAVPLEDKPRRYTLNLKTGKTTDYKFTFEPEFLDEVKRNLKRSAKYHAVMNLERRAKELEKRVQTLQEEIESLTKARKAKMGRAGDRLLYIIPRFISTKEDLCFVCGEKSQIIFKLGGRKKPFGLCMKHYKTICEIEEEITCITV